MRVQDRGRDAGPVSCGYWETQMAQRTLIEGPVPLGAVAGTAMVSKAAIEGLIARYLVELRQSLQYRAGAPSPPDKPTVQVGPPLADFRDMREETDPVRRLARLPVRQPC